MSPINRRQFVTTALLTAMAAAIPGREPFVAAAPANPLMGIVTPQRHPMPKAVVPPLTALPATGSIVVTADSTLSQDFFVSAEVLIGPNADGSPATVIPVVIQDDSGTAAAGSVAAVVLVDNVLSLIAPDSTASTGWAFSSVDPGFTVQTVSALQTTDPGDIFLLLTGQVEPGTQNPMLTFGTLDLSGNWTELSVRDVPGSGAGDIPATPLGTWQANVTPAAQGTGYWYNWTVEEHDGEHYYWANIIYARGDGSAGYASRFQMPHEVGGFGEAPNGYLNSILVADPDSSADGSTDCYGFFQDQPSGHAANTECPVYLVANSAATKGPRWQQIKNGANQVLTSGLLGQPLWQPDAADSSQVAGMLFLDPDGNPYACTCAEDGTFTPYPLLGAGGSIGQVTAGDWFSDGAGTITIYLLAQSASGEAVLYIQNLDLTDSAAHGTVSSLIPIADDVGGFYLARRGMTTQTALCVQGLDTSLQLLSRTAFGVWTATPVLKAPPPPPIPPPTQEVTTYRTLLSVTDTAGVARAGFEITVTPDFDAAVWLNTGSQTLIAGQATTFTTDNLGQVTLAIPAELLHCTPLTVGWTDSTSGPGPQSLRVYPDGELHTFLQGPTGSAGPAGTLLLATPPGPGGTTSLSATSLSGPTLTAAQLPNADGTPSSTALFGGLTSGGDASTAAGQIATIMQTGANGGTPPAASAGFSSTRAQDGTVRFAALKPDHRPNPVLGGSWWDNAVHDLESVYRMIAAKVADIGTFVVDTVSQAGRLVVEIGLTVGDFIADTVSIVVTDLRSAAMAVVGFLRHLGAEIEDAIRWLRLFIGGLFTEIYDLSQFLYGCLTDQAYHAMQGGITALEAFTGTIFQDAEADLSQAFQDMETYFTTNSVAPSSAGATFGPPNPTPNQTAAGSPHQNVKSTWLLDKSKSATSTDEVPGTSDFGPLRTSSARSSGYQTTFTGRLDSFTTPSGGKLMDQGMVDILTLFESLLDDGLELLDTILLDLIKLISTTLADANNMLTSNLDTLPVIGPLLDLLGITDLTIGELMCLVLAFPIVIGSKLLGYESALIPSTAATQDNSLDWVDVVMNSVGICGTLLEMVTNLVSDWTTANNLPTPAVWRWLGVAAGGLMMLPTFPADDLFDPRAPWKAKNGSASAFLFGAATPLVNWVLSGVPILFAAAAAADPADYPVAAWTISALSLVSFALDFAGNVVDQVDPWNYALDALQTLPAALSPLTISELNPPEDLFVPAGAKALADLGCGLPCGFIYLGQAITAVA